MNRPKCDVCGRPATFHDTRIESQVALETHLCFIHSQDRFRTLIDALVPDRVAALGALAERLRRERGG